MSAQPATRRRTRKQARQEKKATRGGLLWRWRRGLFVVGLVVLLGLSAGAWALTSAPLPDEEPLLQTTFVCAADVVEGCDRDNSLAQLSGGEDRVTVTYEQLPPVLIQAVLAAEDRDFFEHSGLDPVAIGRERHGPTSGPRTPSREAPPSPRQYVKNVFLTNERTFTRKLREAVLATKLEQELDKEEILLRYLNTIYLGRGAYGVQAASRAYLARDVGGDGLPEAAYLAGLIRSPESADAWRTLDRSTPAAQREIAEAERRRASVLDAMLEEGYITREQWEEANAVEFGEPYIIQRNESTNFGNVRGAEHGTEYIVEYVRKQLSEAGFTDAQIYGGGLRVYTTLDYGMQAAAYEAVHQTLDREDDPDGSLVAVDDQGRIRAMVGGEDWSTSKVNLATGVEGGGSGRQPGSAMKPAVLATAVDQGVSVLSPFQSLRDVTIPDANAGEDWRVTNYDDQAHGTLDLIEATEKVEDAVYAQLMDHVGASSAAQLAERMGITADLPEVPALVLGAGEVSVLDMASMYSTFANTGEHVEPVMITRVEDREGNVLRSFTPSRERVLDETEARTVNHVLHQVVEDGTGEAAAFGQVAAGKTGTTQEYRDAWFIGYTCRLTAAVWMGYARPDADGSPRVMDDVRGREVTGGSLPATVWRRFMERATQGLDDCPFDPPARFPGRILNPELVTTTVDPESITTTTAAPSTTAPPPTTTTPPPPPTTAPSTTAPPTTAPPPSPPPSTTVAP
ncbi:MAG: transglycosylase domain-containing protein [Acidimicrobiia bacterium]|nr:transglycosylase domain-containing protein [Acidimicrobiia bacterium]